jgi:hypothetical protein
MTMLKRRGFLMSLATGLVALLVVGTVIADELLGVITKVDPAAKELTVVEKDSDKEIKVKVNDETEVVTKKGSQKVDLEKLEGFLEKVQGKGAKGISAKITHEKGVASKIQYLMRKKGAPKKEE